jgi:mersacidin/lichenicidin family type 2 lantibiotic
MAHLDIIRVWKDAAYRQSLTAEQLEQVPPHPAGLSDLSDDVLKAVVGGRRGGGTGGGTGCGTGGNCTGCSPCSGAK